MISRVSPFRRRGLFLFTFAAVVIVASCQVGLAQDRPAAAASPVRVWATGDGVRVDPETSKYVEDRTDIHGDYPTGAYAKRNAVWDAATSTVSLRSARNEFAAFQVIVDRGVTKVKAPSAEKGAKPAAQLDLVAPLEGVKVEFASLTGPGGKKITGQHVALFMAYATRVRKPSRCYQDSSLGPGWFPDPLVPAEPGKPLGFDIPNPRNLIGATQRNQTVWVDIFIPGDRAEAPPGVYKGAVKVSWPGGSKDIAVELKVWDFALPDEIHCRGDIWNGTLKKMSPEAELRYYQMAHRHRIHPGVAGYAPKFKLVEGKAKIDWTKYDARLGRYFDGSAFTEKHGYWGPGYGKPIPHILLPFNCNRPGRDRGGWPIPMPTVGFNGKPVAWKDGRPVIDGSINADELPKHKKMMHFPTAEYEAVFRDTARQVKKHFDSHPIWRKIRKIVFIGGLDEAHNDVMRRELMVYYSRLLREEMGEKWFDFRIDGGYPTSQMNVLHPYVDLWVCHTAGWHHPKMDNFRSKGVETWFYGPMMYERPGNSGSGSNTLTDLDLNVNRGIGWVAWQLRSGYCQWEFDAYIWNEPKRVPRPKIPWEPRWFEAQNCRYISHKTFKEFNGSGLLIYRGVMVDRPGHPLPTIRLKSHRRGMQDYEYFWLLKQAKMGNVADALVNSIVRIKPFGGPNYRNTNIWRHNPEQWDATRITAGELLHNLATQAAKKAK